MPWNPSDAGRFTKAADTEEKRRRWARVANQTLRSCLSRDDSKVSDCEAQAIRVANSTVSRDGKSERA